MTTKEKSLPPNSLNLEPQKKIVKTSGANRSNCKLLVFGGSGHAKDVLDVAKTIGYRQISIVTSDGSCDITGFTAIKEAMCAPEDFANWDCFVAIGNNTHRKRLLTAYSTLRFVSIISPSAEVSDSANIADGCFIGTHAYIGPDSTLGRGCIVNTHSIVGHDSTIGVFSHVGPKVCIAGNVTIAENVFIGAGATLNNGSPDEPLTIPKDVYIGMGCNITHSIKHEGIRIIPKPNYVAVK